MLSLPDLVADYAFALAAQVRHLTDRRDTAAYRTGEGSPVLLLPGVYESWQFMRAAAERVHAAGHPVHVVHTLGYNRRSVVEGAAAAQRYLREHDLRDVTLVAHSKGGLIGKHMMVVDDAEEGRIRRMITVNTPFGGSPYARFAVGRTLREFQPTHATLRMLAAELAVNARITSISSAADQYLPEGSALEGAENIALALTGHFRVLDHPQVLDLIAERV